MNNASPERDYLKSITLLYVEDDELTREIFSEFLSRLVGVLITAENGAEGLNAYQEHNPDIVITDIQMPVMDGMTMIHEIRTLDTFKPIPIFVMTAFDQVEYLKRSIPLDVCEYVFKPLDSAKFTESLLACSRRLLEEKKLRQAQDEVVMSRDIYSDLFQFAPIAYFAFDFQGVIREANHSGGHLLGIERHLLVGKPFSSFAVNDEGKLVFTRHLEAVLQREGMQKCDIRLTASDGTVVFGQLQSVVVGSRVKEEMLILSSVVDGTAGELLKKEIQGALEYAENIVETVREPLVVLNSDLKILTANHSFYDTFKVTPDDTIGNFIYDVGSRQWDIPALRVLLEEILPQETVLNGYEVEHDFPDIGRKTILLNARQIFREDIGSRIILLAMEDITERKQLEVKIQDAREYAENIIETVREPLVVLNSDLKILTANLSFYDTFKVLPEEIIGNLIYEIGNRQWDIPKLRILIEDILVHDTTVEAYVVEQDFIGIGHRVMLLNARQIFREKIGANILLLAIEDITERKMAEKMREDIDRITRHDLKTPLNPIIGFPEILLMDTNLTPEQIEMIQLIRTSGYRMLSIIDSSLSLYKMEQGTYTLTPVCFDLCQLITSIERESALEFAKKRLKLVRHQVGKGVEGVDVFMMNGEELLCYTMLSNLIKNAMEASPPDEVITVSCEEDALWNFISIHNKGTVPEKIRLGFFDKYITSGKKTGTGLGTYSAMLAARTQKGDISMTTSEEKGTLITVRLPKLLHAG